MGRRKSRHQLREPRHKFLIGDDGIQNAFAIERLDDREDYGEQRFVIIGMAERRVFWFVAYTERGERIRIISLRRATQHEQNYYLEQNASTDVH